ncbi:Ribosomal RNA small subunit methyltransferase H [Macleaya cordata]|uniref:Ribosomal RNA small subunit methyltransferase H n=1 Tax=Macleaya cordata TaxID=56857 RepID=A0A200QZ92_MACCD|nr:Ribosomal RNA small subunit methyltransferase H [Macleaya cordata]
MASASATRLFFSILPLHSSTSASAAAVKLFFNKYSNNYNMNNLIIRRRAHTHHFRTTTSTTTATSTSSKNEKKNIKTNKKKKKKKNREKEKRGAAVVSAAAAAAAESSLVKLKRRTRSNRVFELPEHLNHQQRQLLLHGGNSDTHFPVMLGEVLEVFHGYPQRPLLRSFVDCTLGAAGHSSAIIRAHPELQLYVGLDVDPVAHEKAKAYIDNVVNDGSGSTASDLKVITLLKNFKDIKSVLAEVDEKFLIDGVDGILMDLGMSSMQVNNAERGFSVLSDGPLDMRMNPQASLKAEDILNSWPEDEVGRILRDYGEENNWRSLQTKIVKARLKGGLHSTSELVNLIRGTTPKSVGRQGWMKTATRVFQALRIAVNDELKILEDSLYACFDCLSSGGRLAVISFHSLEDRIVKQTFLDIIDVGGDGNGIDEEERCIVKKGYEDKENDEEEAWIKQKIGGRNGIILTKRPITPCEEEETLNRRCRSAKLRVVQKV